MPKNEKIDEAKKLYKAGKKLVDIARELGVPDGTVRRWKSTYDWDGNSSERSVQKKANARLKKDNQYKRHDRELQELLDETLENAELTDRQRLFCIYYVQCFNATKAYQKAYNCDYNSALRAGPRMLGNVGVKSEIQRLKQAHQNREFFSEDDIFQKYIDIAFADITDYMEFGTEEVPVMSMYGPVQVTDEKTGKKTTLTKIVNVARFKDSSQLDGTIISEVKVGRDGASIKLADRMKALEWLTEHMNMATEEQKAKIALLKAKVMNDDGDEAADDGFLDALNASAAGDWSDEED